MVFTALLMLTVLILAISGFFFCYSCWHLNKNRATIAKYKRERWAGAFVGTALGSFIGIAGFGNAIAGTFAGAVCGYVFTAFITSLLRDGGLGMHLELAATRAAKRQVLQAFNSLGSVFNTAASLQRRILRFLRNVFLLGAAVLVILVLVNVNYASLSTYAIDAADRNSTSAVMSPIAPDVVLDGGKQAHSPASAEHAVGKQGVGAPAILSNEITSRNKQLKPDVTSNAMDKRKSTTSQATDALPRACVYSGVMSDDDYRACGIRPPQ